MGRPKKTGHKSHDKVMEQDWQAKQGHNLPGTNPEVQKLFADHESIQVNIKELQKDQKALRVKAKEEFGIPTRVFTTLISLRKMDPNVRAELEMAISDTNTMLGYQMALNLVIPSIEENDPIAAASRKANGPSISETYYEGERFEVENV